MNDLEKRSFYSFLGLYIISSFLFITLIGYWYYISQKESMQQKIYYKMENIADKEASRTIAAQMNLLDYKFIPPQDGIKITLLDRRGRILFGSHKPIIPIAELIQRGYGYFQSGKYSILISDAAKGHMGVAYIIIADKEFALSIEKLRQNVLNLMAIAMTLVIFLSWILSWIFMRPLRQRVAQVERFVNDVSHELNTPVTALTMSVEQAQKSGKCTPKIINNISISTRQLHDIYRSLSYLSFGENREQTEIIDLEKILLETIEYYRPLAQIKKVEIVVESNKMTYKIPKSQQSMLFGNLIGNAIKYSPAGKKIFIKLKNGVFSIQNSGVPIPSDMQKSIFDKYQRASKNAGGFGVGLNVVKRVCQSYNIEIDLSSNKEDGTIFRLKYPL